MKCKDNGQTIDEKYAYWMKCKDPGQSFKTMERALDKRFAN